jgi:hypothetical protein
VQGPRGVTVFTASFRAVSASADTATSSRAGDSVIIRHIMASSWEVNTSATSGEGKSTVGSGVVLVALASPQAICTDQRCSKCSTGIPDAQCVQVCPEGVYVGGVLQ